MKNGTRELFILTAGIAVGAFSFYLSVRTDLEMAYGLKAGLAALQAELERPPSPSEIAFEKRLEAANKRSEELLKDSDPQSDAESDAQWERIEAHLKQL